MGYFNYFIKCMIRNISYKLCKPKVFLTVFLCVILLLFCFKNYGYCSEGVEGYVVIPNGQDGNVVYQFDDAYYNIRKNQEQVQMDLINRLYASYDASPTSTKEFVNVLLSEIKNLGTNYKGFYVEEATEWSQFKIYKYGYNSLTYSHSGFFSDKGTFFGTTVFLKGTFYEYTINGDGSFNSTQVVHDNKAVAYPCLKVLIPEWKQMFIDFGLVQTEFQSDVLTKLDILISQSQQSDNQIANKIEQGNQLQQEQNQIQQEQNDFLKQETNDSDVSIDSFNSVDSNDITSSGLTGIFNTIYNSITSWNSKDILLPIPFTNKSINIPANYTNNMLNSVGGQTLINIVATIYYFIVARFIIYSITGIINSIKSGSILETDTKTNITTDML